jgi:hypothetical protein
MKRISFLHSLLVVAALLAALAFPPASRAADKAGDSGAILDAAESVFRGMAKRDYPAIWAGLSARTRQSIVRAVGKAEEKAGRKGDEDPIRADFEKGGETARAYWEAYLAQFDPKTVLEESKWTMGAVKKDRAEIVLRYRKSDHDAILKLFFEAGAWRVGLDETFSTRQ